MSLRGDIQYGAPVLIAAVEDRGSSRSMKRSGGEDTQLKSTGQSIFGIAATYDKPYRCGDQMEMLGRGCFARSLMKSRAVRLLIDHDERLLVATGADFLSLRNDANELSFRCDVPATDIGRQAAEYVKSGQRPEVSVGFRPIDHEWKAIGGNRVRCIWDAELAEISIVVKGAVTGTRAYLSEGAGDSFDRLMRSLNELADVNADFNRKLANIHAQFG